MSTNQELEYFSWNRPTPPLTTYKLLLLCISFSSSGIIRDHSSFMFHVVCLIPLTSWIKKLHHCDGISLCLRKNCFWCFLFFYLLKTQSAQPFHIVSFSILHWVHPYFASENPLLCHSPSGAKLLKGQTSLHEHLVFHCFHEEWKETKTLWTCTGWGKVLS